MGDGKLKFAVADSGPLIHLAEIGCLRFLRVFDSIAIPDAVWRETVEQNRLSQHEISSASNIQRHSTSYSEVAQFTKDNNLSDLHTGEQECLYLCRKKNIPVLLTDDMAVRDASKRLNKTQNYKVLSLSKGFPSHLLTFLPSALCACRRASPL